MGILGKIVLFGWLPVCVGLFFLLPTRRAIVVATIFGWFFLPYGGFAVAGLPDYSKMTAISLGLIIGLLAVRPAPFFSIRPSWFDLPVTALCLGIIVSDLRNGDSLYAGLADCFSNLVLFGIPYYIGRCYLADWQGVRELRRWLVVIALIYLPLCLYESWAGPSVSAKIYKVQGTYTQPPRYGLGYRPIVFMFSGLEIAMYYAAALMVAFAAWRFGRTRILARVAPGRLVGVLIFGNIMIKSVGALQLGAGGIMLLEACRRARSVTLLVPLALAPFAYEFTRANKIWTGDNLVRWNRSLFGDERAESLEFRLNWENRLLDKAMQQPVWGWGGSGRSRVTDTRGNDISVTDGYWMIMIGSQGWVGLLALTSTLTLPAFLFAWRARGRREWIDTPEAISLLGIVVFLAILMLDFLVNAFPGAPHGLLCGAALGILGRGALPPRHSDGHANRVLADALARAGEVEAAIPVYQKAAAEYALAARSEPGEPLHRFELADCDDALATLLDRVEPGEAAIGLRLRALALRERLANDNPAHPGLRRDLADALASLGRSFRAAGRADEAREAWLRVLEVWETLEAAAARHPELATARAEAYNDLAWALCGHADRRPDDLPLAVDLARRAVEADNTRDDFWNTLGTAYYHAGEWDSAVTSLDASCELADGGTAYDHFLLAMAHHRRGDADRAAAHYQKAVDWIARQGDAAPDLDDLYREAHAALSVVETGHTA